MAIVTPLQCVELPQLGDPLRVRLPGLIELQSYNLLDLVQPAITPLIPIITAAEAILAVFNVIKTIPKAISKLSVDTLLDAIEDAAAKVLALGLMLPQFSLPYLVIDVIDLLVATLDQLLDSLYHLSAEMDRIDAARARADELGDPELLLSVIACAEGNVAIELDNQLSTLQALSKLFALIDVMLKLLGVDDAMPSLDSIGGSNIDEVIESVSDLREALLVVRRAIPLP